MCLMIKLLAFILKYLIAYYNNLAQESPNLIAVSVEIP